VKLQRTCSSEVKLSGIRAYFSFADNFPEPWCCAGGGSRGGFRDDSDDDGRGGGDNFLDNAGETTSRLLVCEFPMAA